ncbi:MAG: hypothetical protein K2Z25_18185 [Beijerinckiaceae bacterium]|nr:hypothetical protein [Hyphomonadaceae bacterium]MBX9910630.1 hypothetical protein [Beijerinckiaceae bacterium]
MLSKRKDILIQDETGGQAAVPRGTFLFIAALHILCCGVPLLLLSGVSLAFLVPLWPVAGAILAVVGVIGFAWYLKRGCATCPRNEGCTVQRKAEDQNGQGI